MPVKQRSSMTQVLAGLVLVIVALAVVAVSGESSSAPASSSLKLPSAAALAPGRAFGSMFQDDNHLIYAPIGTVIRTLNILRGLGVNQIRATVVWKDIAPDAFVSTRPAHFDATNPADYPAASWAAYDRLDRLAHARGMTVNFNVTAPAPLWAVGPHASSAHYADHWMPSSVDFGRFVQALGTRYSGHYPPLSQAAASNALGPVTPLPRVSFWSIWNEPNQPGWLAPQWRSSSSGAVMVAPVLYRSYADAAFAGLVRTGHRPTTDTILVGDLAPEGCVAGVPCPYPRPEWSTPPLPFLRAVYCVSPSSQPLSGAAAVALGCPRAPDPAAFVAAHPGLFQVTGFAHHPYSLSLAPNLPLKNPAFVPLANLGRLERSLDSIFRAYGVNRRLPLYLTEYGYETNPPNPIRGFSPQLQALFLDEAQYLAWLDPRVRTLNQFLLYDYGPNKSFPKGSPGYWSTFQTGLLYANGAAKPSLSAYRLPIFLPDPVARRGRDVFVWGMLRGAPPGSSQRAQVQWRGSSAGVYRTLQRVVVADRSEVLWTRTTVPGPGQIRIQWTAPSGQIEYSRAASVGQG